MKLRISTFNIQNDYSRYTKEKSLEIIQYLKKNKIDILGLQEVYSKLDRDLKQVLNYNYFGKYRFFSHLILKRINEKTPIILKKNVVSYQDYHLPFLPSLLKRIMTKVEIEDGSEHISIYNTHLDYKYDLVKKRQLKKILNILKKDKNKIILLGDFNLKNNNPVFKNFIANLEKLGVYHVDANDRTLKTSKSHKAIDHIFLSESFRLIKKEIVKTIKTSDHYPILIDIET